MANKMKCNQKHTFQVDEDKSKTEGKQLAEVYLSPTTLNTLTIRNFTKGVFDKELNISDAVEVLKEKVKQVNANDTATLEATLTAQASALDAIFNEMARRAALNMGTHLHATESYMRLALKAQSQCARTIEVISNMKNPPIVYAKQANIANGHQQVNNGNFVTNTHAPAHTGKTINQANELLEADHGSKAMDIRTAQTTKR